MEIIYKIMPSEMWEQMKTTGRFTGAPVDLADGYIHFSTGAQVRETAARHFAGRKGLVLLAVPTDAFGDKLKWEPSRGGDLFPHLYRPLELGEVLIAHPLPLQASGSHLFPDDVR